MIAFDNESSGKAGASLLLLICNGKAGHIKEFESLLIRIANRAGIFVSNAQVCTAKIGGK